MTCTACNDGHTADTCPGPAFRYDGGAGGVWTFCKWRMTLTVLAHDADPTLERSWLENVEAVA